MAIPDHLSKQSLAELIGYLFTRREAMLNNWRAACEKDPSLGKVSALSREEFNNLLPIILIILEQRLLDKPAENDLSLTAEGHGLHRWQKSLDLMDTIRELNHFTQTLYGELETFMQLFPDIDKEMLLYVHRQIALLMQETIDGSLHKYDELQRLQASTRAASLQTAIDQMQNMALERSDLLRTSSHDLRSSFGIINSTAVLLNMEDVTPHERQQYLDMMNRSLTNVHEMLTGLMDLSRLEAGQETIEMETVDAAKLLNDMISGAQHMAEEKNIILQADGPDTLIVETDRIKLQRIIQNILVNAIKYTPGNDERSGIISISWSNEGEHRWIFSIQDSGPGMPDALDNIFIEQLHPTIDSSSVMSPDQAEPVAVIPENIPEIPSAAKLADITNHTIKSEGVGLQIVKRLCELLDANLDIESIKGRGTLFRVRLPLHGHHQSGQE